MPTTLISRPESKKTPGFGKGRISRLFLDPVDVVWTHVVNLYLLSVSPGDRDLPGRALGQGKNPDRVVAGQIPATSNHFLSLPDWPSCESDFRADALRVLSRAL